MTLAHLGSGTTNLASYANTGGNYLNGRISKVYSCVIFSQLRKFLICIIEISLTLITNRTNHLHFQKNVPLKSADNHDICRS